MSSVSVPIFFSLSLFPLDREVKKEFENYVNPETAQNLRAKQMEEELRKNRKRKEMLAEGTDHRRKQRR